MALSRACTTQKPCTASRAPRAAPMSVPRPVSPKATGQDAAEQLLKMGVDALKNNPAIKAQANALKGQAIAAVGMSAAAVKSALEIGLSAWGKYDTNGDGKLSISEALELLNGPEIAQAVEQATGQPHSKRTEKDIKAWFERADFDHSGTLSKREFATMYAGLLCEKAAGNFGFLSSALISALGAATGPDSKVGLGELQKLMQLVSPSK